MRNARAVSVVGSVLHPGGRAFEHKGDIVAHERAGIPHGRSVTPNRWLGAVDPGGVPRWAVRRGYGDERATVTGNARLPVRDAQGVPVHTSGSVCQSRARSSVWRIHLAAYVSPCSVCMCVCVGGALTQGYIGTRTTLVYWHTRRQCFHRRPCIAATLLGRTRQCRGTLLRWMPARTCNTQGLHA
jgi:hypothetical protein